MNFPLCTVDVLIDRASLKWLDYVIKYHAASQKGGQHTARWLETKLTEPEGLVIRLSRTANFSNRCDINSTALNHHQFHLTTFSNNGHRSICGPGHPGSCS